VPARAQVAQSLLSSVALAIVAVGPILEAPSADAARTRPYLLGDSVAAWSADVLTRELGRSGLVLDALACRGTVLSCVAPGQTTRPPSGLSTIRAKRGRLGSLVVIELGYNDRPLRSSIDRLLRELRSQGVGRVAWINLSERRSGYHDTNVALDAAAKRWPELRILDWRTASAGRGSWFVDGVHLTGSGKVAFARFLAESFSRLR
jgi:hypothetical protein